MKKGLIYIVLSVIAVTSLLFNVYLYIEYQNITEYISDLKDEKLTLSNENQTLLKQVNELKASVSDLEERNYKQAIQLSDLIMGKGNSTYSNNTVNQKDNSCAIPGCNSRANNNSFYCSRHECFNVGCHEKIANDFCNYCISHKCFVPNCNSGQAYNSVYCFAHNK